MKSKLKYQIADLTRFAKRNGGKCLSSKYVGVMHGYRWQCKERHEWKANWNNIQRGKWCPRCVRNVLLTDKEIKGRLHSAGFTWVSGKYDNNRSKLIVKCKRCKKASTKTLGSLKGCIFCAGVSPRSIKEFQEIARLRGGKCLSTEYKGLKGKLMFECANGHTFKAWPLTVMHKSTWCDQCRQSALSFPQEIVRQILEAIYETPFPTKGAKWLGARQTLDGYSEELSLAFEFHGRQHREFVKHFHRNDRDFKNQVGRDKRKLRKCKAAGVQLLIVWDHEFKMHTIDETIKKKLKALGVAIPKHTFNKRTLKVPPAQIEMTNRIKRRLKEKKLNLLSDGYLGQKIPIEYKCLVCGEEISQFSDVIFRKAWSGCPVCAGARRLTITEVKRRLKKAGFRLSKEVEYKNAHQKLPLMCNNGHKTMKNLHNVDCGYGCLICSQEKRRLKRK